MAEKKRFPVLWPYNRAQIKLLEELGCPRFVPWEFIAKHRAGCLRNHEQTPERLAERGGLGVSEMVAVVDGLNLSAACKPDHELGYWPFLQKRRVKDKL